MDDASPDREIRPAERGAAPGPHAANRKLGLLLALVAVVFLAGALGVGALALLVPA